MTHSIPRGGVRHPSSIRIHYLYEMIGGIAPVGLIRSWIQIEGSPLMAASLNQQTMWLYRQFQRVDDDPDEDAGIRRHLGIHYKAGARPGVITSIRKLTAKERSARQTITWETDYEARVEDTESEKNIKSNNFRVQKAEKEIALIEKKVFLDKDH